jgi:hypothetical protein
MHAPKILASAIVAMLATPVAAQEANDNAGAGPQGSYYGHSDGYYGHYRDGPGRFAGDVVGGAIGTAGAIAAAPFRAMRGNGAYAMAPDYCYRHRSC